MGSDELSPLLDSSGVEADLLRTCPLHPLESPQEALLRSVELFDSANSPLFGVRVIPLELPDELA